MKKRKSPKKLLDETKERNNERTKEDTIFEETVKNESQKMVHKTKRGEEKLEADDKISVKERR